MDAHDGGVRAGLEGMPSPPPRTAHFYEYAAWLNQVGERMEQERARREERMRRLRRLEVLAISLASAVAVGFAVGVAVGFAERPTPVTEVKVRQ